MGTVLGKNGTCTICKIIIHTLHNFRSMVHLNLKGKTINNLENNIETYLHYLGVSKIY